MMEAEVGKIIISLFSSIDAYFVIVCCGVLYFLLKSKLKEDFRKEFSSLSLCESRHSNIDQTLQQIRIEIKDLRSDLTSLILSLKNQG